MKALTSEQKIFLAYFFHEVKRGGPDIDGYMGSFWVPDEVMSVYKQMFAKERGWE